MQWLARVLDAVRSVGLGYRPDPDDARDLRLSLDGDIQLPIGLPSSVSYRGQAPAVLHQGSTKSCVGHALASGLELAMRLDRGTTFPVSPWALWFWARAAEGEEDLDDGTHLRTAMKQAQTLGIPPEQLWGRTQFQVRPPHNKQPSFACLRAAAKLRGLRGYMRIPKGDTDGIRRALAARKPVVFGMNVDRAFTLQAGSSRIDRMPGEAIGGHALLCIGYRMLDGRDYFEIANSWGTGWRDGGFAFLSEALMGGARDCWALDVHPEVR